jgi:hypothetical protein
MFSNEANRFIGVVGSIEREKHILSAFLLLNDSHDCNVCFLVD